ncbi:hypothetical protein SLA2020_517400 [Shorea laevis]
MTIKYQIKYAEKISDEFTKTYEFFDDSLVDEDRDGNSEQADEGQVAASPTEVVFEILSRGAPLLYEPVLVRLHSSPHFRSLLLLDYSDSQLLWFLRLPVSSKETVWLQLPSSKWAVLFSISRKWAVQPVFNKFGSSFGPNGLDMGLDKIKAQI